MRTLIVVAWTACLLFPHDAGAQSTGLSAVRLAHGTVRPGDVQTLTVMARDLAGHPLAGASIVASIHYRTVLRTYHLRHAGQSGQSSVTFHVPPGVQGQALVDIEITNGYLKEALTAQFSVRSGSPPPSSTSLVVLANVLPPEVTAAEPAWIAVYAHTRTGAAVAGARIVATATFREGTLQTSGTTAGNGSATLRLATDIARSDQTVRVTVAVTSGSQHGSGSAQFDVRQPAPTPAAPPSPSPAPTSAPPPTAAPTPLPSPAPAVLAVATPTAPPTPTPTGTAITIPTPTPTATLVPTPTPLPGFAASSTSTPTATPSPTATLSPTPTFTPTPTLTPVSFITGTPPTVTPPATSGPAACPGTVNGHDGCIDAMLSMINQTRAQNGVASLQLNLTQSLGTSSCPGAYGHSRAMAQQGQLFHSDPLLSEFCVPFTSLIGQNIGYWSSGNELQDLSNIHSEMMSEPHSPSYCAQAGNHACNILDPTFTQIGIGIYNANGTTWLTQDFIG